MPIAWSPSASGEITRIPLTLCPAGTLYLTSTGSSAGVAPGIVVHEVHSHSSSFRLLDCVCDQICRPAHVDRDVIPGRQRTPSVMSCAFFGSFQKRGSTGKYLPNSGAARRIAPPGYKRRGLSHIPYARARHRPRRSPPLLRSLSPAAAHRSIPAGPARPAACATGRSDPPAPWQPARRQSRRISGSMRVAPH